MLQQEKNTDGRVLVVDDDEVILQTAAGILGRAYEVILCQEGREAVALAEKEQPDLILLDINLVGVSGFDVLRDLKKSQIVCETPVMFVTADEDREKEAQGLKRGATDFIRKPFVPEVLIQRTRRAIALERYQKDLRGEVRKQSRRAERLTREMMMALSQTVDAKDHYTNGHSVRVATYAAEIGRRMGKSPEEQRKLYEIGLLHDIGKIGIPEEIINKTERLTDEEFGKIKEHTVIGDGILQGIVDMPELRYGARSHHERYDGSGYPDRLAGEAIPEAARIICVADCYDAMTSTRTYSEPKPQDVVRAEIVRCSGKQFDPRVAQVFLEMMDDDPDYLMSERGGASRVWKEKERLWDLAESETAEEAAAAAGTLAGTGTFSEAGDAAPEVQIPEALRNIEGLDPGKGIANCGSAESFLSVLDVFRKTAGRKAGEIKACYDASDTANYTIKVHALKSAARIIGADRLSEMARALEMAAKAGDIDTIRRGTGEMLSVFQKLDEDLRAAGQQEGSLKEMSASSRKEAFQTLLEIAQSLDYGMMDDLLKELKSYRLSGEDAETLREIEEKLLQLDWEGIRVILEEKS